MNDNYLWDRTGEPDPEIQRLEELLGTLRYEPRPLAIPAAPPAGHFRRFVPALAIAATIALMLLAAGVWFALNRKAAVQPEVAKTGPAEQQSSRKQTAGTNPTTAPQNPPSPLITVEAPLRRHRNTLASGPRRRTDETVATDMSATEVAVAKDQLMLALRVASLKLNIAQRRTQPTTPTTPIRNQHRIG